MRLLYALLLVTLTVCTAGAQSRRATLPPGYDYRVHTTPDSVHHVAIRPGPGGTFPTVTEIATWMGHGPGTDAASAEVVVVDAGEGVEADNISDVAYSSDGSRVLVTHLLTDNLTILDAATREVLANVPVGDFPLDVAANAEVALVVSVFSREVHVVDLATYAVRAVIPMPEQPVRVVLSPDGQTAYVATEVTDTCQIVDLTTNTVVGQLDGFPVGTVTFIFTNYIDRIGFRHNPFLVTPDGSRIVVGQYSESDPRLLVFDVASRTLTANIPLPAFARGLDLSEDGSVAVFGEFAFDQVVGRVDLSTLTVTATVARPAYDFGNDVVASADGDRALFSAYLPAAGSPEAVVVHFDGTPDRRLSVSFNEFVVRTPDHRYALLGGGRSAVVDLDAEAVVWTQDELGFEYYGAASPLGTGFASASPFLAEGVTFVGLAGGTVSVDGYTETGEPAEGDGPYRVRPLPGGRALVANHISGNLTLVDAASAEVEAVVPAVRGTFDAAVTADGQHAVVVGTSGDVRLLALPTGAVVAEGNAPYYLINLAPTPDGEVVFASGYEFSTPFDRLVVLERDGATYEMTASYPGYVSEFVATPDGAFVLAPTFEPSGTRTHVFDGRTGALLGQELDGASTSGGAASSDSRYAVVFESQSGLVTTFAFTESGYALAGSFDVPAEIGDVEFVPGAAEVWVASPTALRRYDVVTGALLDTRAVPAPAYLLEVAPGGEPLAYLSNAAGASFWSGGFATPLPNGFVTDFAYSPQADAALFVGGLDKVTIVREVNVATEPVPGAPSAFILTVGPNPSAGRVGVRLSLPAAVPDARVDVFDALGRRVAVLHIGLLRAGMHALALDTSALPAGVYVVRATNGAGFQASRTVTVVR